MPGGPAHDSLLNSIRLDAAADNDPSTSSDGYEPALGTIDNSHIISDNDFNFGANVRNEW